MAWQPIDTAPRDGTRILCFVPEWGEGYQIEVGRFDERIEIVNGEERYRSARWWIGGGIGIEPPQPTHWMPLPPPPEPTP